MKMRATLLGATFLYCAIVFPLAAQHAPLPEKLISAETIYLINDSGDLKAYDKFYEELKKWGRFVIVTSRNQADAIVVLTSSADYAVTIGTGTVVSSANVSTVIGNAVSIPETYLHLKVFDAATGEPLWSDRLINGSRVDMLRRS